MASVVPTGVRVFVWVRGQGIREIMGQEQDM